MKPSQRKHSTQRQGGFTFLEIVVTLIVAAILGAVLVEFMGTSMMRSAEPLIAVQKTADLTGVMERISADYDYLLEQDRWNNTNLALSTLKTRVDSPVDPDYNLVDGQAPDTVTKYVSFSPAGSDYVEDAAEDTVNLDILKVTVDNGEQELSALFTKRN